MRELKSEELEKIAGGTDIITGTIINAFTNVLKLLIDSGREVGSAIRRISENKVCPLE